MKYGFFLSVFLMSLLGMSSCSQVQKLPHSGEVSQTASGVIGSGSEDKSNTGGITKNPEKENPTTQKGTGDIDLNNYGLILKSGEFTNFLINHIKGEENSVTFTNTDGKNLKVKISFLGGSGNLRLSQIVAPDGTMDGPFGIESEYKLTQSGNYTLRFNENQMAGDPWDGTAQVNIGLSK